MTDNSEGKGRPITLGQDGIVPEDVLEQARATYEEIVRLMAQTKAMHSAGYSVVQAAKALSATHKDYGLSEADVMARCEVHYRFLDRERRAITERIRKSGPFDPSMVEMRHGAT